MCEKFSKYFHSQQADHALTFAITYTQYVDCMLHTWVFCKSQSFSPSLLQRVWRAVTCRRSHKTLWQYRTCICIHIYQCVYTSSPLSPGSRSWNWRRRSILFAQRPSWGRNGIIWVSLNRGLFPFLLWKLVVYFESLNELCWAFEKS